VRGIVLVAVLAAAFAPAAAFASTHDQIAASRDCTALVAKMGPVAFDKAYPSFGVCVSRFVPLEQSNTTSANTTCAQLYGKNGYGSCVASTAQASSQVEQQGRLNPAQTCRAQRAAMGAATFARMYGRSARCVSTVAKAQNANETNGAATCKGEQDDPDFATKNGGRTFADFYGTNPFGRCVSTNAQLASNAQSTATVSAAKACSAEQNAGASAFAAKYGSFARSVASKTAGG
jgi:hypothetical protein